MSNAGTSVAGLSAELLTRLYLQRETFQRLPKVFSTSDRFFRSSSLRCSCQTRWTSQLHGLSQCINGKSRWTQLFWLAVLLLCFCLGLYNTIEVVGDYVGDQTATLMTIQQVDRLQFPSLVICPTRPDAIDIDALTANIREALSDANDEDAYKLAAFAVAGYGFSNMENVIQRLSKEELLRLTSLFDRWKGNRSLTEMFRLVFEENGYKCEKVLYYCYLGSAPLNCCELFQPTYVMLRSRCLRLGSLYQNDNEEAAKLSVALSNIPSFTESSGLQDRVTLYVSDNHPDVALTPRYTLNVDQWNRLRFRMRHIELLPTASITSSCRTKPDSEGRYTCTLEHWLEETIVKPFNCTLVYLQSHAVDKPVCHPSVIVANYARAVLAPTTSFTCEVACTQEDIRIQLSSSLSMYTDDDPRKFQLEASYGELEYEEYKEVMTVTLPGVISQIGGQGVLFLGASVITFLQLLVVCSEIAHQRCRSLFRWIKESKVFF